jgi:hypothetical protein
LRIASLILLASAPGVSLSWLSGHSLDCRPQCSDAEGCDRLTGPSHTLAEWMAGRAGANVRINLT